MKPFLFSVAIATVLITFCPSFSSVKSAPSINSGISVKPNAPVNSFVNAMPSPDRWITNRQNTKYYWFIVNGDVYDGYYTLGQEIGRMETLTGLYCDNDQSGNLVSRGYTLPIKPHLVWPSAFVFSH